MDVNRRRFKVFCKSASAKFWLFPFLPKLQIQVRNIIRYNSVLRNSKSLLQKHSKQQTDRALHVAVPVDQHLARSTCATKLRRSSHRLRNVVGERMFGSVNMAPLLKNLRQTQQKKEPTENSSAYRKRQCSRI